MKTVFLILLACCVFHMIFGDILDAADAMEEAEEFNAGHHQHPLNYHPAMRSFGRTAHLNEAVYNAQCNPHGIYHVMRYNQPCDFRAKNKVGGFPYQFGYYNPCGKQIA